MSKRKRINIVLDAKSYNKLKKAKKSNDDTTYTHTIKRAIGLYDFFLSEKAKESIFYIKRKNSENLLQIEKF